MQPISPLIIALVLGAAILHATWNALLRSTSDRRWGMLVLNLACPFMSVPIILCSPLPPLAAWPYILISGVFVTGYNICLFKAYEHGELSQVYPVARGISPLLVTIGSMFLAGEHLGFHAIIGICLISFGILALAEVREHPHRKAFIAALMTGCCIAAYTVTDGMGGRVAGNALGYVAWRSFVCTFIIFTIYWRDYRVMRLNLRDVETQKAIGAAAIGLFGYTVIIWAMKTHPMGIISALRETSVVFAVLIGWFFLKEKVTWQRITACVVIASGAICLG
jgi:drug/metabolite transporter (DMT)-like permease